MFFGTIWRQNVDSHNASKSSNGGGAAVFFRRRIRRRRETRLLALGQATRIQILQTVDPINFLVNG